MKNLKIRRKLIGYVCAAIMLSSQVSGIATVHASEDVSDNIVEETTVCMEESVVGAPSEAPGGGGPGSDSSVTWSGATTINSAQTQSAQTYSSTTAAQNALLIDTSEAVTINDPTVTKSGDSNGDTASFYGINSGIMVKGGGITTIKGGTITTNGSGANGVFSYGGSATTNNSSTDGTTVIISDTTITTTGNGSGGIMTTGGGTTKASNLTVETSGTSSAAIRTDRGGGTVVVDGGTYTSNGLGSPAIYSTADVTVNNATLTSNKSEGVCIEGRNSITLKNTNLTANNTGLNGNATFYDSIMIYQSQSGDAADGTSEFSMTGGTLTSRNGHVFHVTNTSAVINLNDANIVNEDSAGVLLTVCDDGWSGASNVATLNANDQDMEGAILVGDDSTLNLNLSGATTFTGYTSGSITNGKGNAVSNSSGTVNVKMTGGEAIWVLTADSSISSISGSGKINYNGHTLTVAGKAYTSGSPADGIMESSDTRSSGEKNTTDDSVSENSVNNVSLLVTGDKSLNIASVLNPTGVKKIKYYVVSGDKKVASVNKKGQVKAKKAGTVTYGISTKNGKTWTDGSLTYVINVEVPTVIKSKTVSVGEKLAVTSLISDTSFAPQNLNVKDESILTLDNDTLTAKSAGKTKISFTLGGKKYTVKIFVK
ncbi:MAG: hypothetical protein IKR56_07060 [Lachnospiraceae bacterium]|nr:hypothetical protein [Lachnospiraceae bacterium]